MQKIMPISKFIFGLICLSVLLKAPLVNADIEDAHAYRSDKNYKAAYEEYSEAADNGNALAMLVLGHMHYNGNGTEKSYKEAFKWYKKSAEKGNARAMTKVSDLYFYSCNIYPGHPVDVEKALEWTKKSAVAGYEYAKKHGVPSLETYIKNKEMDLANDTTGYQKGFYAARECDKTTATIEWKKAANNGDGNSMYALAKRYQHTDTERFDHWLDKAVNAKHGPASHHKGVLYEEQGYYKRALQYYLASSKAGYKKAEKGIARMRNRPVAELVIQSLVKQNPEDADSQYELAKELFEYVRKAWDKLAVRTYPKIMELYAKAAEQGHFKAQDQLARIYRDGVRMAFASEKYIIEKDIDKYIFWRTKIANNGHIDSMVNLANYFGDNKEDKKSFMWKKRAAVLGDSSAQNSVALDYYSGRGTAKNPTETVKWLETSIDNGNKDKTTKAFLGHMYEHGLGVDKNYKEAFNLYKDIDYDDRLYRLKNKVIVKWSDDLFENRFFVYDFTHHEMIPDVETINSQSRKNDPSETIRLHGQRIIKKIWIDVEVKLNEDGTIERDNSDNIALCKIKAKSKNLLDDIIGSACFKGRNNNALLDKVIGYFW